MPAKQKRQRGYLLSKKSGRVYPWTPMRAKRKEMVPCDSPNAKLPKEPAEPVANEPAGDEQTTGGDEVTGEQSGEQPDDLSDAIVVNDQRVSLAKASRDVMADYADRHFGVKLDRRRSQGVLADELRALIAEHGHPDADD